MASRQFDDPRIPDRENFRIGEVAKIADVEPHVLRFWEGEFPSLKPKKSAAGQRTFRRKDIALVLRIRDLLYEQGFTIEGARKQLKSKHVPVPTPARTRSALEQVRKEALELLQLVSE